MAVSFAKPSAGAGRSVGRGGARGGMSVSFEGLDEAAEKLDALRQMVLARWDVSITSDSPYIGFVTEGTRPHLILPRGARALHWPGAAHPVAMVHHPGTAPNPFIEDAYAARASELAERAVGILEQGVNDANPRAGEQAAQLAANVLLGELRARAPRRTGALAASLRTQFMVGRA
jgi:hypothetical protein